MPTEQHPQPRVTLVGAGPGDPDLISVRGVKALAEADVVLFDALVHPDLLAYAPASAKKIFVGKREGNHAYTQDQINELIVESARAYGHAVRLKGGDPFVFGRGHEEMAYAATYHIPSTVVPGISSAIAVPELQHIPLTRRGVSESFWVITGTTTANRVSEDVYAAAKSNATVIILMGLHKLAEIMAIFGEAGKGATPVAVIQNGTLPEERVGLGTVATIGEVVREQKLKAPAILVVGEVVRLHPHLAEAVRERVQR